MTQSDVTRKLVEIAIDKGISDIETDPDRGIRKLVDLGLDFSIGRFQKSFFELTSTMLRNEQSAYYTLIRDSVAMFSHDAIKRLGINVGYNSWTMGARIIRENEAKYGFNIPWLIGAQLSQSGSVTADTLSGVIKDGRDIGIFSYWLVISDAPSLLTAVELAERFPDCEIAIFAVSGIVTGEFVLAIEGVHNILVSVPVSDEEAAHLLLPTGCMLCRHIIYDDSNIDFITSGDFVTETVDLGFRTACLVVSPSCSSKANSEAVEYVRNLRANQTHPIALTELFSDIIYVDHIISGEPCFMWIGSDGKITVATDHIHETGIEISSDALRQILYSAMPRVGYTEE